MEIKIKKSFAPNTSNEEFDILQLKKALNQLGYYTPRADTGIKPIADKEIFEALKAFQKDYALKSTGELRPDDENVQAINKALQTTEGVYMWHTVNDDNVRDAHKDFHNTIRDWSNSPDPGEDFNCRCWAEVLKSDIDYIYDPPLEHVYPELLLIPILRIGKILRIIGSLLNNPSKKNNYTNHGSLRSSQRKISPKDIQDAIKSAKETGNVTTKVGKYGTPQNIYKGSNGLTIVEETQGRNAGKVITLWWHK